MTAAPHPARTSPGAAQASPGEIRIATTDHSHCEVGSPCLAGRPVAEVPARKLICLRLVEHANGIKFKPAERCQSERLPGSDLCAHHLADAFREYSAILRPEDFTGGIHE